MPTAIWTNSILADDIFLRVGLGSGNEIRIMSGTDIWFWVDADKQRLGNNAAGNSYFEVEQSPKETQLVIDGNRYLWFAPDSDTVVLGDKVNADAYIELELNNWDIEYHSKNTHRFFNNGNLVALFDSTGFNLLGGLDTSNYRIRPEGGGGDITFENDLLDKKTTFQNCWHTKK